MSSMPTHHCDIAVLGGGLVGLCAALALASRGKQVEVIEASSLTPDYTDGLNARSIALSYSSMQIFKALDVWSSIKKWATAIENIQVSSQGRWGVTRLDSKTMGIAAMGYVIESRYLAACLLEKVTASNNINLRTEASFESIHNGESAQIDFMHQGQYQRLNAALAIIADGANSNARTRLGIDHKTIDYAQSAIITNIECQKPLAAMAFERFTHQGPLAILPLGGKRYACVWTRDHQSAAELMQLDDSNFSDALQTCFGYRLGTIERIGKRFSFDLKRTQALALGKQRCLLVGNAANALHPVAGQGFNLALRDIAVLYEMLGEEGYADKLDDIAMSQLLERYQTDRHQEHNQVIRLGDGLVSLFSNSLPMLDHLRAGGLAALDLFPALKVQAAMAGMGMTFGGNAMLRGRL